MPSNTTPSAADQAEDTPVVAEVAPVVEEVVPIDDGDAGGLAAWEAANYARAHQPSPITEE